MKIYVNTAGRCLTDGAGGSALGVPDRLTFYEGTREVLFVTFYEGSTPFALTDGDTFKVNLDSNFLHTDNLMAQSTNVEVSDGPAGEATVRIDFRSSSFSDKLAGKEKITAWLEILLYRAGTETPIVLLQTEVNAHALVGDYESAAPVAVENYYTKTQIDALFRAGLEFQYSVDGETWDATAQTGYYMRFRNAALGGEWSDPVRFRGEDGQDGRDGQDGQNGQNGQDGRDGQDGQNGQDGRDGQDGTDLDWDAAGVPAELSLYDDQPAGFRFAATEIDYAERCTTIWIYKKASDATADWLDPLVIKRWSEKGRDGTNAALIPPQEFEAPENGESVLSVSLGDNTAATIAAVCIDTPDGELRLPYASARGILSIVTNRTAKTTRITFGASVPEYSTGRIYFAQGVSYVYDVTDAPADGKIYARQYGAWVEVTASAPSDPDEEEDPFDNLVDPGNYSDELVIVGG